MIKHLVLACCASMALLVASAASASASGNITASYAWIRLLPGSLPAAAYVQLNNDGDQTARLSGASSAAFAKVMLHQSTHTDGMAHMHMVPGMDIPAHGSAALAPGSYHLMLTQRTDELAPGDSVTLNLKFADGSHMEVPFKVRPANAGSDSD